MRILGGSQGFGSPAKKEVSGSERQNRSEFIADIFNNQVSGKEGKKDVKVRLSYTSRRLTQELNGRIGGFLKENHVIADELSKVELPENPYGSQASSNESLQGRKLFSYLNWLRIRENDDPTAEVAPAEEPFKAIQQEKKDEEIKAIYREYDAQRLDAKELRNRHAPTYYYLAYPEAYSFN